MDLLKRRAVSVLIEINYVQTGDQSLFFDTFVQSSLLYKEFLDMVLREPTLRFNVND